MSLTSRGLRAVSKLTGMASLLFRLCGRSPHDSPLVIGPRALTLIGLEPVPARVYSRRCEAGGFQGRAADWIGQEIGEAVEARNHAAVVDRQNWGGGLD